MRREVFKTDFECPHCNKKHEDYDGNYLRRLNKSRTNSIHVDCDCKNKFLLVITFSGSLKGVKRVRREVV
jgi:transcription elongation factor Elf1